MVLLKFTEMCALVMLLFLKIMIRFYKKQNVAEEVNFRIDILPYKGPSMTFEVKLNLTKDLRFHKEIEMSIKICS